MEECACGAEGGVRRAADGMIVAYCSAQCNSFAATQHGMTHDVVAYLPIESVITHLLCLLAYRTRVAGHEDADQMGGGRELRWRGR